MTEKEPFDKSDMVMFIVVFVVAISLLIAASLGPAVGNIFVASGQADILLPQEQHDLDAAQSQIFQMSPGLGSEMLTSALAFEIGLLTLIVATFSACFKGRFIKVGFAINALCSISLLGIAVVARQMMTTTSAINVYPLTGNPWDKNKLISMVQGFANGAQTISETSFIAGLILIAITALCFLLIRRLVNHRIST